MKPAVAVITCWYPSKSKPSGVFIREIALATHCYSSYTTIVYFVSIENGRGFLNKERIEYNDEGIPVVQITLKSKLYKFLYILPPLIYLFIRKDFNERVLQKQRVVLLHSHVIHPAGIVGYLLATKHQLPHVITEHWSRLNKYFGRSLFRSLARKAYYSAKKVIAVSAFLGQNVRKHVPDLTPHIIPNVVADCFQYKPFEIDRSIIRFISIGTWKEPKRLDLILHALNQYSLRTNDTVEFVLVGDGPQLTLTERSFDFTLIKRGYISKKEIAEEFATCHALLHASDHETFSLVIAEALCCGLPVIASRAGAIPELVNTTNGLLVANTKQSWDDTISNFFKMKFDRAAIAKEAQSFAAESVAKQYELLYNTTTG